MVFVHNVVCELVILDDIKVLLCSEVMQQKRKNAEKEFNMMEKREDEEGVRVLMILSATCKTSRSNCIGLSNTNL